LVTAWNKFSKMEIKKIKVAFFCNNHFCRDVNLEKTRDPIIGWKKTN